MDEVELIKHSRGGRCVQVLVDVLLGYASLSGHHLSAEATARSEERNADNEINIFNSVEFSTTKVKRKSSFSYTIFGWLICALRH